MDQNLILSKIISSLNVNGKTISNPKEILIAEHDYFLDLYTNRTDSSDECYIESLNIFIHQPNIPKLSDQQHEELERIFTEKEILDSLKQLKKGRTPRTL